MAALLEQDAIVAVRGRLDLREDQPKLICRDLRRLELTAPGSDPPVEVVLPLNRLTDSLVRQIRELVSEHPGNCAVHLRVGEKVLRLPPQFNVDPRGGLVGALEGAAWAPPPSRGEWSGERHLAGHRFNPVHCWWSEPGRARAAGHVRGSASPRAARICKARSEAVSQVGRAAG